MPDISIRPARSADARAFAALSVQLGYACDEITMTQRLKIALQSPDHAVFAGVRGSATLGWIHVMRTFHLESGYGAEIAGLVVAEDSRGQGIGTRLAQEAVAWAGARGFERLRVRSNVTRHGAHAFYLGLGYESEKVQHVFMCALR